ncbi:MAG: ATP-binding protein [Candidatus Thorarchaeota archaeon]
MFSEWNEHILQNAKNFEDWRSAKTIPVNVELKGSQKILHLDQAISYLEDAKHIYRLHCMCRSTIKKCDAPTDTCIAWDSAKGLLDEEFYKYAGTREVTKEEAIETLKMSHDAGLVHMAYAMRDDEVNRICSCCSTCCVVFTSVLKYKMFPELISSDYRSVTDMDVCVSCGTCVDRCHFEARELTDDGLQAKEDLCFGCGLCVSTCPEQAISLVKK